MGKLVSVVGNSGVGKTTFARKLCQEPDYAIGLEQHEQRPFQELFMGNHQRYALANQVDYLLFRAEQEIQLRKGHNTGILDGGLDQDFFVFTKLFYRNSYLTEDEYAICEKIYWVLRESLPPPDLIIWMKAPLEELVERFKRRKRRLDITQTEDMGTIEILLEDWLGENRETPIYVIEAEYEDRSYSKVIPLVKDIIDSLK